MGRLYFGLEAYCFRPRTTANHSWTKLHYTCARNQSTDNCSNAGGTAPHADPARLVLAPALTCCLQVLYLPKYASRETPIHGGTTIPAHSCALHQLAVKYVKSEVHTLVTLDSADAPRGEARPRRRSNRRFSGSSTAQRWNVRTLTKHLRSLNLLDLSNAPATHAGSQNASDALCSAHLRTRHLTSYKHTPDHEPPIAPR